MVSEITDFVSMIVYLLSIIVSVVGFYAGVALLKDKPSALKLSLFIQVIQIPVIFSKPIIYTFILGIGTPLFFWGVPIHLNVKLGGEFTLLLGNNDSEVILGLNLWAMFIFIYACSIMNIRFLKNK